VDITFFKSVKPIQQVKRRIYTKIVEQPSQIQHRIKYCCSTGRMDEAKHFFEKLDKQFRNVFVYNQMINGYCKQDKIENALKLFETMKNENVSPDVVTFNTIIDYYCKSGEMKKAEEWFYKMQNENISADVVTFNTFIDYFCKSNDMKTAEECFKKCNNSKLNQM
jgi:pentatricopeptide repeat protein